METYFYFRPSVIEPVHVLPPPRSVKTSEWQDVPLEVPQEPTARTPVPPPRKKRSRRTGAAAVSTPTMTPPPKPPHPPHRSISAIVRPSIDDSQLLKPRHKNISTVSLPNYEELEIKVKNDNNKCLLKPENPSLGASMSSVSEATLERLETYLRRNRSFSSLATEQIVDQLNRSAAESSDDDSVDDDWGLGIIEHPISPGEGPPLSPTHQLPVKRKKSGDTSSPSSDRKSISASIDSQRDTLPADAKTDTKKTEIANKKSEDDGKDIPEHEPANRFFDDEEVVGWFEKEGEDGETDKVDEELKTIVYDFSSKRDLNSKSEADKKTPSDASKNRTSTESKTPPPSPEPMDFLEVDEASSKITRSGTPTCFLSTGHVCRGEKETPEKLHRVLNEFCESSNRVLTDGDAEDILKELGLPMDLKDEVEKWQKRKRSTICPPDSSGLSSGRSSTTPSLSELEAAISDLLEKNNKCGEDVDDNVAPKSAFIPVPSNLPQSRNNNDNTEKNKNTNHIILKPVPIISVSSEPFTN